ncbi:MAG: transcriptional regulator [Lachnospiraceae bacterium]|nr:transcriptional regulator [Lachnospiraceae bacterium]
MPKPKKPKAPKQPKIPKEPKISKQPAFDFKKEYKEFYLPGKKPELVTVPAMNFIAVRGFGDPNEEGGAYKEAISLLYGIAFTIKMSKMGDHRIEGYFDYVVPPLEGLWWQEGIKGIDYAHKEKFQWISMIRLPDFVTKEEFSWAVTEAETKKGVDYSKVEFFTYEEGLCVQCMHVGPYDNEPETIALMDQFAKERGYVPDFENGRYHHELYLSDVRRCKPENLKTVIRHPVQKI